MQLRERGTRTVLALAVCQLLIACAQPANNTFVSHFGASSYSFPTAEDPLDDDGAKKDGQESQAKPRLMLGDGTVLAAPAAMPAVKGNPVKLSFEDAPLSQVVRAILGDLLKQDFVLHPPIEGRVTLNTQKPVPADQALNLLETALQAHGMAMVRDTKGAFHVGKAEALKNLGASVRQAGAGALAPGLGAIIVPLQYIGAAEMASILKPMMGDANILRVDSIRNLLVLAGTRAQAEGWLDMVRTFDVNLLKGMSVGVFPLKYVTIQEVNSALQMLNSGAAAAGVAAAAAPGAAPAKPGAGAAAQAGGQPAVADGGSFFGALRILPLERLNSVLIVTPRAEYLQEAQRWIAKLDQPGAGGSQARLNIYRVQNGNASHLASVLGGVFGNGQSTGSQANSGVAPGLGTSMGSTGSNMGSGFGGGLGGGLGTSVSSGLGSGMGGGLGLGRNQGMQTQSGGVQGQTRGGVTNVSHIDGVRIMADELNNSVLIWGAPAEYERIEAALKRLDVPPTQVLIEASIIEVTLNDSLKYGLQWAFRGGLGNSSSSGSGSLGNPSGGVSDALSSGFSYTISSAAGRVQALLSALSTKTNLKVVASPSLMVLDNHTAAIVVGNQQPYQSAQIRSAEGGSTTTSIQYKDTGVNLQVTPSVNAGNLVTMSVVQSVTDVGPVDEPTQQRSFLQRQIASRVAVRSGESIVMGGLIQENANQGRSGLPYLHDIPVVGNLFGTTEKTTVRTELVVVITPRVVRSDVDIRAVTDSLKVQMNSLRGLLSVEPKPQSSLAPAAPAAIPEAAPAATPATAPAVVNQPAMLPGPSGAEASSR